MKEYVKMTGIRVNLCIYWRGRRCGSTNRYYEEDITKTNWYTSECIVCQAGERLHNIV